MKQSLKYPQIWYYYTHPEGEYEKTGNFYGFPYIPTFGHIGTHIDAHRILGISNVVDRSESWCMTDVYCAASLGRIIDGPIQSVEDIRNAEVALQAILLYDYVDIIVPAFKGDYSLSNISYIRLDNEIRKQAAFDAFNNLNCRDCLFTSEYLDIDNDRIINSSSKESVVVGKEVQSLSSFLPHYTKILSSSINAFATDLKIPVYLSAQAANGLIASDNLGFIKELYSRISKSWVDIAQAVPSMDISLKLPPLISIVLSRSNSRENIPDTIKVLREELHETRSELCYLNNALNNLTTQADLKALTEKVISSFDAIVPESLLTKSQRNYRTFAQVFALIKPTRQLYSILVDPSNLSSSQFKEIYNSMEEQVAKNPRIVSRTITAKTFSNLLRTESIINIIDTHFTKSEKEMLRNHSSHRLHGT